MPGASTLWWVLSLAFFCLQWGLPLTVRSVFYPLLGEKIFTAGRATPLTFWRVASTLFGLATSLGFGAFSRLMLA